MYLLLQHGEDGNLITELTSATLQNLLDDPQGWGVRAFVAPHFLDAGEWGERSAANWDTGYWPEGCAMLLKVEPIVPVPSGKLRLP